MEQQMNNSLEHLMLQVHTEIELVLNMLALKDNGLINQQHHLLKI
jgi:hypothetical protein